MIELKEEHRHLPHYLSLGAGVQSSTLALMYALGELEPMPKAAIFADTQAEPESVYKWLDWLQDQLPYPVHRVTAGSLAENEVVLRVSKNNGKRYRKTLVPVFADKGDGTKGIIGRGCTRDYKINPIRKHVKKLEGIKRGEKEPQMVSVIGISWDERLRMKPSRDPWAICTWPLVGKRITRLMCKEWMESHGYPEPPRSACSFCPFHSDQEWRRLKETEPAAFLEAVKFEKAIQEAHKQDEMMEFPPYLHASCKPLDEIDFRNDVDRGQMTFWDEECEGMCGI